MTGQGADRLLLSLSGLTALYAPGAGPTELGAESRNRISLSDS